MTRVQASRPVTAAVSTPAVRAVAPVRAQAAPAPETAKKEDVEKGDIEAYATVLRDDRYAVAVASSALKAKQDARDAAAAEYGKAVEAAKRLTGDNTALYQARIDRLEGYLAEAQTKLAQARQPGLAKAQTLEAEAARVGSELDAATQKLSATKSRISWLIQDTSYQEARRDRAEREKSAAESDISRLESQVSPSKISSQQSRVRSAQWDVDSEESRVSSARSKVSSLESRISSINSEISSLQNSTDPGASSKISSLRSELSGVKSQLSSAESDLRSAQYRLSDAESDLRREKAELARLEDLMRQLENARSRRDSAIRTINDAENELDAHARELPQQQALVPVTEAVISAKTGDRAELLNRAKALRVEKNPESHPQVAEARRAVESLQKELTEAKKTFDTRTADPKAELADAQKHYDAQMAPFLQDVADAEAAVKAARQTLDGHQNAVADLARQVGGFTKFMWRLSSFNLDAFMDAALKD